MIKPLSIVITTTIAVPVTDSFDYIVPVDLSHIFHPLIFLPGVTRTNEAHHWSSEGISRTVFFTDGSTAKEELLSVKRPLSFSYKISNFTGINRFMISSINGSWSFNEEANSTAITWTYSILCHNIFTKTLMAAASPVLRRYLQTALSIVKKDLEETNKEVI